MKPVIRRKTQISGRRIRILRAIRIFPASRLPDQSIRRSLHRIGIKWNSFTAKIHLPHRKQKFICRNPMYLRTRASIRHQWQKINLQTPTLIHITNKPFRLKTESRSRVKCDLLPVFFSYRKCSFKSSSSNSNKHRSYALMIFVSSYLS